MGLSSILRSITPQSARAKLRRSSLVNKLLHALYAGPTSRPHPRAPYQLHVDGYQMVGWSISGLGSMETAELSLIEDLFRRIPCRCAWDIGANIGFWSLFLAGLQPKIERIVCFEPDPHNLGFLKKNKEANRLEQMEIRKLAMSSKPGQMTFYRDPVTGSTGSLEADSNFIGKYYKQEVEAKVVAVSTMDLELCQGTPAPDFIKLDVEGHELSALRGGAKMLETVRPLLMLEVTLHHPEVSALLTSHGYRLIDVHQRKWIEQVQFNTVAVHDSVADRLAGLLER